MAGSSSKTSKAALNSGFALRWATRSVSLMTGPLQRMKQWMNEHRERRYDTRGDEEMGREERRRTVPATPDVVPYPIRIYHATKTTLPSSWKRDSRAIWKF